ncbi:Ig-like domain-containing protein [Rhodococcus sp. TAF43]|uniref:Ig-like domain-containing protein n=1 Tax=Rhodococcus sp. TAF43 TaxID=3237483 RepID=UPI003F9553F0
MTKTTTWHEEREMGMSSRTKRRLVAAAGVAALSAGLTVVLGAGTAGAASDSVTWNDGSTKFTRSVSNTTPNEGDVITVSTKFERTAIPGEYIYAVKDLHPTCLTYVDGSAKVNGSVRGLESQGADFARVQGSSVEWPVGALINGKPHTFEFSYRVGADCARGVALTSAMHYSGSLGSGEYDNKAPSITVVKNTTTTALAAVPGAQVGKSVTLSATVTGGAEGNPVDFYDGGAKVGSGQLNASGVATFAWSPSTAGARSVQAKFAGTPFANGSESGVQSVSVAEADVPTTTTVTVPPSALTGTAVNLTAKVEPGVASGTVQFKDGDTNIGAPVPVTAGTAQVSHTFASAGTHPIMAAFTGVGFVSSASEPQLVSVTDPDLKTTTTVTAPSAAQAGAAATLSASVSPKPTGGTVQFKDGATAIGGPIAVVDGAATLDHAFTSVGSHRITATYSGAAGFEPSTSPPQSVSVTDPVVAPRGTVTLLSVPGEAKSGVVTDLWATVRTSAGVAVDGGTVQFRDGGADLGAPIVVTDGVVRLPHTFSGVGAHAISAVFSGVSSLDGSTAVTRMVNVTAPAPTDADTATALTVPAGAASGSTVRLWASVVSSGPVDGTVQFFDGDTPIGEAVELVDGVATRDHAFTTSGAHRITAVYSGAAGLKGSSSDVRVVEITSTETAPGGTTGTGSLAGLPSFGS